MPRMLKKNWPLILLVTMAVVASGSIWWLRGGEATAADQPVAIDSPAATPPVTADDNSFRPGTPWVQPVVKRLGLAGDEMIALNLNAEQARAVRAIVRDWCDSHCASLAATFSQSGTARETQLAPALVDMEGRVAALLTPSQGTTWQNLRQCQDLPIAYRLAAPNDEQRAKLKKILQARWYGLQAAKSPSERQQVQARFDEKVGTTLGGSQLAMINAYQGYRVAAATAIAEPVQADGPATTCDW